MQVAKQIVILDTCNDTDKYKILPSEAQQLKVTMTLEEKFPNSSFQVVTSHKLPRLIMESTGDRLFYFRNCFHFVQDQVGLRPMVRPFTTISCNNNFKITMHMWDDSRPMGINISNFIEIKPFVDYGPSFAVRVPDLPACFTPR